MFLFCTPSAAFLERSTPTWFDTSCPSAATRVGEVREACLRVHAKGHESGENGAPRRRARHGSHLEGDAAGLVAVRHLRCGFVGVVDHAVRRMRLWKVNGLCWSSSLAADQVSRQIRFRQFRGHGKNERMGWRSGKSDSVAFRRSIFRVMSHRERDMRGVDRSVELSRAAPVPHCPRSWCDSHH